MQPPAPTTRTAGSNPAPNPEWELLLHCARAELKGDRADRVERLLADGLDWQFLESTARAHGTLPLLYSHLQNLDSGAVRDDVPADVPADVLERLRARFQYLRRRNLSFTAELVRLIVDLEAAGIPVIAFKGPVLASSVFGDFGLREFDDIDILVHFEDVPAATTYLEERGYVPWIEVSEDRAKTLQETQYARHFGDADTGVGVDLHWDFSNPFYAFGIDTDDVWRSAIEVEIAGTRVRTLCAEKLLLVLCVHGAKHDPFPWNRLKWICDVAEFLRAEPKIAWNEIMHDAAESGSERVLLLGLLLAYRLLDAPLPAMIHEKIERDRKLPELADEASSRLFAGGDSPPGVIDKALFDLRMLEDWRDRGRYLVRGVLTPSPKDWGQLRLPDALSPLYFLVRIYRFARRGHSS